MSGTFKPPIQQIFPEKTTVGVSPTPEEITAVGKAIAAGYLDPLSCAKMEPSYKTKTTMVGLKQAISMKLVDPKEKDEEGNFLYIDENGNLVEKDAEGEPFTFPHEVPVIVGGQYLFDEDENGNFIMKAMGVVNFGKRGERIRWAILGLDVSAERKRELLSVKHMFKDVDEILKTEARMIGRKIDMLMCSENGPATKAELLAELAPLENHVSVESYMERHIKAATQKWDKVYFKEYLDSFAGYRKDARVLRIMKEIREALSDLSEEDGETMLTEIEATIPEIIEG
jgi:hypothetical protein